MLLGSAQVKAACKYVDEIDPSSQFNQPIGAQHRWAGAQRLYFTNKTVTNCATECRSNLD